MTMLLPKKAFPMKKSRIASLATLLTTSVAVTCACADSRAFEGFSVGADVQFASHSLQVNDWVNNVFPAGIGTLNGTAGNQQIPNLKLAYGVALGSLALVDLGGAIDLTNSKLLSDPNGAFLATPFNDVEQRSHYSLFVEPGFTIGNSTKVYGKVAYHSFKLNDPNPTKSIANQTFGGLGLGAGLATKFWGNWSVFIEFEQVKYNRKSDLVVNGGPPVANIVPKSTIGSVGIQYHFN